MNELDKAIIGLTNTKIELIQTNSKYDEIIENLDKEVKRQHKEIERLNNIINKAIEYINTMPLTKGTEWYRIELLEILKEVDKE